jgi:uroporphyrinogen decarboxylase
MSNFPPLQNDLLIRAARREPVERTPVWIMRQAGRYLPEYRALRADEAFFDVVRTPELATEVTLQPLRRFPLDAAIIFSDILVVPQAMGLHVEMIPGQGPYFPEPLRTVEELRRLRRPVIAEALHYVLEALTMTRKALGGKVPLIGFCGAPWTLMAYMVEGGGSKTFSQAKGWLYRVPEASHRLLSLLTDVLVDFLIAQIDAGAQVVQVFDSWAGVLSPEMYRTFALPYLRRIGEAVGQARSGVPRIVFARGAHATLAELASSSYDVVGIDWTIDPRQARQVTQGRVALQGNLDPCALYADPKTIRHLTHQMLQAFGPRGHIANLGHGLHPTHDPERVRVFVEAVHDYAPVTSVE